MRIRSVLTAAALVLAGAQVAIAGPFDRLFDSGPAAAVSGTVEAGFSPEGSAEQLVLRALGSAHHSIRLCAFSLTSPVVVRELIDAKRRGVDVAVVADERQNVREDRSGKGRAALNLLVNAGIPTRTVSVYAELHDKFALIDGETVQTGSFNYSAAAARRNSENAIVIWRDGSLARSYLDHWQSRWSQGVDYRSSY
ncbi:endonuclease [Burkholderia ubonensis]|uniref:phospholipase D family nuclease n=1 Tax=Burkholderia ubonensis TaxID=101571 RepID=UPI00075B5151|nr:phospholipase D family protein [Burkholderia ubonensis]KWN79238.1 endonuclease [Burkholderia ubonensis]